MCYEARSQRTREGKQLVKYVLSFGASDSSPNARRTLDDGSTRESLSEDCRAAALCFMSGVAAGWDKLDLALWLTGPYARATRHARRGERVDVANANGVHAVAAESIETLLTRARVQLIASLEKAALELGVPAFANEMVERGLVRRVVDADRRAAWIPVDAARLRLKDRLQALFAADYLNVPYAYAELFVCHRCEAVVFDAHAKRVGICGVHRLSGILPSADEEGPISPSQSVSRRS